MAVKHFLVGSNWRSATCYGFLFFRSSSTHSASNSNFPQKAGLSVSDALVRGLADAFENANATLMAERCLRGTRTEDLPKSLVGSSRAAYKDCPWWTPPEIAKAPRGSFTGIAGSCSTGGRLLTESNRSGPGVSRQLKSSANCSRHRQRMMKAEMERLGWERWSPNNKIPRESMERLRELYKQLDDEGNARFSKSQLGRSFGVSFEAVRRILRSKWQPPSDIAAKMDEKRKTEHEIRKKELKKAAIQNLKLTAKYGNPGVLSDMVNKDTVKKLQFGDTIELLDEDIHVVRVQSANDVMASRSPQ